MRIRTSRCVAPASAFPKRWTKVEQWLQSFWPYGSESPIAMSFSGRGRGCVVSPPEASDAPARTKTATTALALDTPRPRCSPRTPLIVGGARSARNPRASAARLATPQAIVSAPYPAPLIDGESEPRHRSYGLRTPRFPCPCARLDNMGQAPFLRVRFPHAGAAEGSAWALAFARHGEGRRPQLDAEARRLQNACG